MRLFGILLVVISGGYSVKIYTGYLKEQLSTLKDWLIILSFWRAQIESFGFSVDEMIANLRSDITTRSVQTAQIISDKSLGEIVEMLKADRVLAEPEREVILGVLKGLGASLSDTQIGMLDRATDKLQKIIEEREQTVKERCTLLYKLAPLLCGAAVVLLW